MTRGGGRWLELESWPRRGHYDFFRTFEEPFFSVCTDVRVSELFARSRAPGGPSFFLGTMYASLRASNAVEEFRLRLRPDGVWLHDRIDIGSTVMRGDETFGFAYFAHADSWQQFNRAASAEVERVARSTGATDPRDDRDDLIHHSVLPWIRLTSFAHARRRNPLDSVPKIVFGRHFEREGERWMPVAVDVHHALADGLHVARWLERLESELALVGAEPPLDQPAR